MKKLLQLLNITVLQGFELTTLAVNFATCVFILFLHDCLRHMDVVVVVIIGIVSDFYDRSSGSPQVGYVLSGVGVGVGQAENSDQATKKKAEGEM